MSQHSSHSTSAQPQGLDDMQAALAELHAGLLSLKASLIDLARFQQEEQAQRLAQEETHRLLDRVRRLA